MCGVQTQFPTPNRMPGSTQLFAPEYQPGKKSGASRHASTVYMAWGFEIYRDGFRGMCAHLKQLLDTGHSKFAARPWFHEGGRRVMPLTEPPHKPLA